MGITSQEIDNQSFSVDRKGYSIEEVDVFLERISAGVDELNKAISQADNKAQVNFDNTINALKNEKENLINTLNQKNAEIEKLNKEVQEKAADGKAISEALIVAQRSAETVVNEAKQKATKIVDDATDKAKFLVNEAENQKAKINEDISALEIQKDEIYEKYQNMLKDIVSKIEKYIDSDSDSIDFSTNVVQEENITLDPGVTAENAPIPPKNNFESKPLINVNPSAPKDFSGFGDTDFGEDKID